MNEYEEKLAAKQERLAAAAQAEHERATAAQSQPGMKGITASVKHTANAKELERRANAVGTGGISSDDPEAIAKLTAQLEAATAWQAHMVAANKLVRKQDRDGLRALGLDDGDIHTLFNPRYGRPGYPGWQLSNNNAKIKRIAGRIADIQANQTTAGAFAAITGDGWTIDVEDNRVVINFAARVPLEQYRHLRGYGFVRAPSRGDNSFVRKFSFDALYWAKVIVGAPTELPTVSTSTSVDNGAG